jgi:hypothetical protein
MLKNMKMYFFEKTGTKRVTFVTLFFLFLCVFSLTSNKAYSATYQTTPEFLSENFSVPPSKAKSLWLTPELKKLSTEILSRPVRGMRVRYYSENDKTAWILEEIGKERPITVGVIVNGNIEDFHIEHVKVLAFRESRGWEVRYPSFTNQYKNVRMTPNYELDQNIDGITGATLSVWALNKIARLALFYHQQVLALN